jgi:hypothetical protein
MLIPFNNLYYPPPYPYPYPIGVLSVPRGHSRSHGGVRALQRVVPQLLCGSHGRAGRLWCVVWCVVCGVVWCEWVFYIFVQMYNVDVDACMQVYVYMYIYTTQYNSPLTSPHISHICPTYIAGEDGGRGGRGRGPVHVSSLRPS